MPLEPSRNLWLAAARKYAVAHYVKRHRASRLAGVNEKPGAGAGSNPAERGQIGPIAVGRMHGAHCEQAGPAVGRLAKGLGRRAVAARCDGADLVAALPEQEPGVVVRGEFVLVTG
jgi:hypothetical protein